MGKFSPSRTSVASQLIGAGRVVEVLETVDEGAGDATLLVAELKKGIILHSSGGSARTATTDTAANIIAGIPLTADNQCFKVYYINDGDQEVTFAGGTNVTIADTAQLGTPDGGMILIFQRTGAAAVKMYMVGGAPTED
jgi:hypothetical protein